MKIHTKGRLNELAVYIPSKLAVAFDLKCGDYYEWKIVDMGRVTLQRSRVNDGRRGKQYKLTKSRNRLVITFPIILFTALGWVPDQQFEWKAGRHSLILKKGLTYDIKWKRQNLE